MNSMKTTTILLGLAFGIFFVLTVVPYTDTVYPIHGSIFMDGTVDITGVSDDDVGACPSVGAPPDGEYKACIKITSNRTVEEMMVYHPDKPYSTTIDDEGYVTTHFNLTPDEFAADVIRFGEINVTAYEELWYNKTTIDTVRDFFDRCPVYSGNGQCVSSSRYYAFEAKKHNLSLQTCVIGGHGSAQHTGKHQVNTFKYEGVRYFTANLDCTDTTIQTSRQLINAVNEKFNTPIKSLNARNFWAP